MPYQRQAGHFHTNSFFVKHNKSQITIKMVMLSNADGLLIQSHSKLYRWTQLCADLFKLLLQFNKKTNSQTYFNNNKWIVVSSVFCVENRTTLEAAGM